MTAPLFTTADHPKQESFARAVFSGEYKYLLAGGAIRGGKSAICLTIICALAKMFPGSRWAVVRQDLPTLRRNTIPTFNKFAPRPFVGPINQTDWTATCQNGSQIIFFSESLSEDPDYNRWRGLEVNGFLLEEANELSGDERSFHVAIQRAGAWIIPHAKVQPPPLILLTCNPSPGWVKELFYDPWTEGNSDAQPQGKLEAPYYFEQMLPSDNHYLTQQYLDSLEEIQRRNPDEYNRMVLGRWEFPAGAVFEEIRVGRHRVDARDRVLSHRRIVAADWGTANIAPAIWAEIDAGLDDAPRLHCYQEWGPSDMPPVRWAEGVLERSGYDFRTRQWTNPAERIEQVILDASCWDNAPRSWTGGLRNPGPPIAVQMAPVFRKAEVRLTPSVKGPDSVRYGVDLLHTYFDTYRDQLDPLLTISESCTELWKALTRIKRGDPLKGKDRVPAENQHPLVDWCDALRYLVQGRPHEAMATTEQLASRDPLKRLERDPITVHEMRNSGLVAADPVRDLDERVERHSIPWQRPHRRR